ncbi:MAG: hypothetical protein AAF224_02905 [Pseudomonadota bacterium]
MGTVKRPARSTDILTVVDSAIRLHERALCLQTNGYRLPTTKYNGLFPYRASTASIIAHSPLAFGVDATTT